MYVYGKFYWVYVESNIEKRISKKALIVSVTTSSSSSLGSKTNHKCIKFWVT